MSIELVNVSKAFGETQVLRGLSERFAQGEAVCVMGRSGLGKTTLARIVMGLEKPDAGAVRGAKGKRFAAAFQEDRLVERLSAQGNLRFACGAALDEPRMAEAFAAVGLTPQDVEKPAFRRAAAACGAAAGLAGSGGRGGAGRTVQGPGRSRAAGGRRICAAYAGRAHAAVHHPRGGRRGAAGRAGVPPAGGGGTAGRTIRKGPKP